MNVIQEFNPMGIQSVDITHEKIVKLQDELLHLEQSDIETKHTFFDKIYERTIIIPPWTVLTGAAHKTNYKIRLEKGKIAVNIGNEIKILEAPLEFDANAGEQRVGRVFDDEVVWTDIYQNEDNCHNIEMLEERLYVVPDCGLGENRNKVKKAQLDYKLFLEQIGLNQEQMNKIVDTDDLIDFPNSVYLELKDSTIHGKGLFALKEFKKGETICAGRIDGKRTPAGKFINHSFENNVVPIKVNDDIYAVASKNIHVNEELLVDYRASMRVNFGISLLGEL
jgi:hypothetical protein